MTRIEGHSEKSFLLNGDLLNKKYELVNGIYKDTVSLVSAFNKSERIFENIKFDEISIDGLTFGSRFELLEGFEAYVPNFNKPQAGGLNYVLNKEVLTGDTWIDGKPIYSKIVKFEGVLLNNSGGIDLIEYFGNIETICPKSSIFTDWTNDNGLKFFGMTIAGEYYYTLYSNYLYAKRFDDELAFNLGVLDSIILALEYTKV